MPEKRIGVSHHAAWKRLLLAISAGALLLLVNNSPALGQSQEPGKIVQLAMNDAQIREQILRETAGSKLLQAMAALPRITKPPCHADRRLQAP
jgi:hypothetical protein